MPRTQMHPEVEEALRAGRAVVALETAVLTHGLPREPLPAGQSIALAGWDAGGPTNLELSRAMQRIVRESGAVPATIAVLDGALHIGLDDEELQRLAGDDRALKASTGTLAHALASRANAGTTVSATLIACRLADPAPIRVLATGGIGGVHADWTRLPDVSADLRQLAATPVCVVCSGAKSIMDLPATLEALDTLGVPVVGYRTDCFPRFHAPGDPSLPTPMRTDDPSAAARLCRCHWDDLRQTSGVLLANPITDSDAMIADDLRAAVDAANEIADARGVTGAARTPFLLAELSRLTEGRSLRANIALLLNNARLAAETALRIAAAAIEG